MKIVVPNSFKILSHKGCVVHLSRQDLEKKVREVCPRTKEVDTHVGLYEPSTHTIYILDTLQGTELVQCYFHELMHCILDSIGQDELSEDEGFVDLFSEVLLQTLLSSTVKKEKKQKKEKEIFKI